jgi:hypothetical protein
MYTCKDSIKTCKACVTPITRAKMGRIEDALQLSAPAVLNIKIIKLQVQ